MPVQNSTPHPKNDTLKIRGGFISNGNRIHIGIVMSETSSPDDDDICEHEPDMTLMKLGHRFSQESENAQDDFEAYMRLINTLSERGMDIQKSLPTPTFESFQMSWRHSENSKEYKDKYVSFTRRYIEQMKETPIFQLLKAPCRKCSKVLLIWRADSEGMKLDWEGVKLDWIEVVS